MSISLKWKKIFQIQKCHSSVFRRVFEISRKKFSCHIHFKLQSPSKVLACLPTFAASVWEIYQFIPHPWFNVGYRDEFVIARFQHFRGGMGFPIPAMPLLIVSKMACQHIFMLSDSGVPRTLVVDCSSNPIQRIQKWSIASLSFSLNNFRWLCQKIIKVRTYVLRIFRKFCHWK